jgi:hypothetical protein
MLTLRIGLCVGFAVALVGCSKSGPSSRLTGTVTYKGEPVKAGTIYLVYEQGGQYEAAIRQDGSYQFGDLPTGNVKVLIDTETFNPEQKPKSYTGYAKGMAKGFSEYNATVGKGEKASGDKPGSSTVILTKEQKEELAKVYVKIPRKYASEKTTTLTTTIEPGSQTRNFDLTD